MTGEKEEEKGEGGGSVEIDEAMVWSVHLLFMSV